MEIIIGWVVYKIHWEKFKTKGIHTVGNEELLELSLNRMDKDDYKIHKIEFVYTREN